MKKLLLIDNSVGDDYNAVAQLSASSFPIPCDTVNLYTGDPAPSLEGYTHLLSTGCTRSVCRPEPWMEVLEDLFRQALDRDMPLLGICFSHQLLAKVVAGPDYVRQRGAPELGWVEQELLQDDPLLGPKGTLWGFQYHFDEVCPLPPEKAELLVRSETCAVEAFRVKGKRAWGLQGHFEESVESGRAMLSHHPDLAPLVQNASAPRDGGIWPELLARFCALEPGALA